MRKLIAAFGVVLVSALGAGTAQAAVCTSQVNGGDWDVAATWDCGAVPTANDTVIIAANVTMNEVRRQPKTVAGLTINVGATLTAGNNADLTVTGNVVNNGTYSSGGERVFMTGAGSTISGTGSFANTDLRIDALNVTLTAGSTMNFSGGGEIRLGSNAPASLTIAGTITDVGHTAGQRILRVDNNNASTLTITGTLNTPNSFVEIQSPNNATNTVTNKGAVNILFLDGANDNTSTWIQDPNSSLTMAQSAQGWSGSFDASAAGNTVIYGAGATPITPTTSYYNLTLPGAVCPLAFPVTGSSPCVVLAPTVTTDPATAVSAITATLNGTVSSNNASTTVMFDYGTTIAYGSTVAAAESPLASTANAAPVTAALTGLACETTYHYRVSATNSAGTSTGADLTFTTGSCSAIPTSATASPTSCVNAAGIGNRAWTTLDALASDNLYASRSLNDGDISNYLMCTGYGFSIPAGSTITGITLNVERSAAATSIQDAAVRLVKGGVIGVTDRAMATGWPAVDTYVPYGGGADLWGDVWTVADINNGAFGAALAAQKVGAAGKGIATDVDHMEITVNYILPPWPTVISIDRASTNPAAPNTSVDWQVLFGTPVTGVDAGDFILLQSGGAAGAAITNVTGSNNSWTVTVNTGSGTTGTVQLVLRDDDSIIDGNGTPLGGIGANNGDYAGQSYTIAVPVCDGTALFCDDFERSVIAGGANAANAVGVAPGYGAWTSTVSGACAGIAGNAGCSGIDSDIPPFSTPTSPRANPTRAMFTRWSTVAVDTPVIDLSGKSGAQVSFWLRRGSDCFSEWPSNNLTPCGGVINPFTPTNGEEFQVQYLNNVGTWIPLAMYPMDDAPGEILTPTIDLPDDALHAAFQLRFFQPGGSGSNATNGGAPGVRGYDYWHLDNLIVREVPAVPYTGPFCDTFEGDLSRWTITGVGGARLGTTYFQNGAQGLDLRWNTVTVTSKATDISTATQNIEFWVKRGTGALTSTPNPTGSDYPETGKDLVVEYLNNLGTWITLATFPGGGLDGEVFSPATTPGTNSFPMPADARWPGFKMRFTMTSGSGMFDKDYWHIDDVCIGTTITSTDLSLAMTSSGTFTPGQYVTYDITVTNNGPNVEPGPITIVDTLPTGLTYAGAGWACTAAGQVVTCTRTGSLAAGASAVLNLTAVVDAGASGVVTNSATVGGQSNDSVLGNNTATLADNVFVPGYIFTDRACTSGVPVGSGANPCLPVAWSPSVAGVDRGSVYITAVNGAGVPTQLSGATATTVGMQFGLSCHNPVANAGVQASFAGATLPLCESNGADPTTWTASTNLSFAAGSPSVGPFTFNYADVGQVELFMRNAADVAQVGTSGPFVVKPYSFVLSGITRTSDGFANPAAPDAAGTAFVKAGEQFTATVTAIALGGAATPNYGQETGTADSVKLVPALVAPLDCDGNPANDPDCLNPAVGGTFGAFTNGVASGTAFTWDSVGIITLTPKVGDGDYLGQGDVTGTASANVGRFYPAGLTVVHTPAAACGGFTYAGIFDAVAGADLKTGQPFIFSTTVTALRGDGTAAKNYYGAFAKLTAANVTGTPMVGGVATGALRTWAVDPLNFANGSSTFDTTAAYAFNALGVPVDMYLRIAANDGEVAGNEDDNAKTVNYRIGRLVAHNASGSELLGLAVPLRIESYTAAGYATETLDGCTALDAAAHIDLVEEGGAVFTGADTVNVGTKTTTAVLTSPAAGEGAVTLAAPGTGGTGFVDLGVDLTAFSWLQFDWDGNGTHDNSPSARATFGIYPGKSNHIYLRELY